MNTTGTGLGTKHVLTSIRKWCTKGLLLSKATNIHVFQFVGVFLFHYLQEKVQFYQKPLLLVKLHPQCFCWDNVYDTHVSNNGQVTAWNPYLKTFRVKYRLMCISFFTNNDAPKVQLSPANQPCFSCREALSRHFWAVSKKPGRFHQEVPTPSWAGSLKAAQERTEATESCVKTQRWSWSPCSSLLSSSVLSVLAFSLMTYTGHTQVGFLETIKESKKKKKV